MMAQQVELSDSTVKCKLPNIATSDKVQKLAEVTEHVREPQSSPKTNVCDKLQFVDEESIVYQPDKSKMEGHSERGCQLSLRVSEVAVSRTEQSSLETKCEEVERVMQKLDLSNCSDTDEDSMKNVAQVVLDKEHKQEKITTQKESIKERLISSMHEAVPCITLYCNTLKHMEAAVATITEEMMKLESTLSAILLDIHSQFGVVKENSILQEVAECLAKSLEIVTALCVFVECNFERLGNPGLSQKMAACLLSVEHWFWDCSQESDNFCDILSRKGMILHFFYQLGELRKNSTQIVVVRELMLKSIGVLNSFVVRCKYHKQFSDIDYYNTLTPYISSPQKQLRFASLFTLSYLVGIIPQEQIHLLAIDKTEVAMMVQELSLSISTNEIHLSGLVFSTVEILTVLTNLALLPENGILLICNGILGTINELLKSMDGDIRQKSLHLLWNLPHLEKRADFESIISKFQPISTDEIEIRMAIGFKINLHMYSTDMSKALLAMKACYKYHEYEKCTEIFEAIKSMLSSSDSKESEMVKLLRAKALFHLYKKERMTLSKFSRDIKQYKMQHTCCYLKVKEIILMLGNALDKKYLDAEGSKFLDLSMIDYVEETNNLKVCNRCMLCRNKTRLKRSHLWPESLLRFYKSGVDSPANHKLFYKISEDGVLSTFSPHKFSFWMFCSECEQRFCNNGESQCIPLITNYVYDISDPESPSRHLHLRYKEWFYHFCVGLIFRGLVSPDPHVSITTFTNEDEIYDLLVLCRKAILDLPNMKDIGDKFKIAVLFTPRFVQDDKHSGFINSLLTSSGLFALSDACLSDGSVCKPREAQFFLAHYGVFNIVVPLGRSHEVSFFQECLIAPMKGTYSIPPGNQRMKLLPPGLMTFFRLLADCSEVQFLVQPEKLEARGEWVEPPLEREETIGHNVAIDEDIEQTGGIIRSSWFTSNPKVLSYLPHAFQILKPFHQPSSVILPPGHKILLHHSFTANDKYMSTIFLANGSDNVYSQSNPYIILHRYDKYGDQVNCGFFMSPETLMATEFLPDNLKKSLTSYFNKTEADELGPKIREMLHIKGFESIYSVLLHFERDRNTKTFDKKCHPQRCWYCRDLCEICMQQCVVGCEVIDHNHLMYTFCFACWEAIQKLKTENNEDSWPQITLLQLENAENLESNEGLFPFHRTLLSFKCSFDTFDHVKISVCVGDTNGPYRCPYILTQTSSLINQDQSECFISKDYSPVQPLPYCNDSEPMQSKIKRLRDEELVQSLLRTVLSSEDCKETASILDTYFLADNV